LFLLESIDIEQLIVKIFQNKIQKAYLYHPDEKEIMKTLKAKIPVCKAGGGFVHNKKGEVLFIFRNGKWDLPKGGIEKGEEIEDTAMREVEEETGVNQLRVTKKRLDIANAPFHSRQSVCKPILIALQDFWKKWGPLSFSVAMLL
jgi:hypothetical protein